MTRAVAAGDVLEVRFDAVAPRGDAIASSGLEKPIYAAGVLPGEVARVRVRRVRKNWVAVDVEAVTEPSPDRVQPRCPLFEGCSGCQFQHVAYPRQLELKRRMVAEQLAQCGKLGEFEDAQSLPVRDVIGAQSPWNYRNHARFTVKDGRLGFVRRFRRQWFEVPECHIMEPRINGVLGKLQGELQGATQCNIRVGAEPDQVMIQPALDLARLGLQSGQSHVVESLHGTDFPVAASAFFQVNRAQAERLVDVVREAVGDDPDAVVADAYAGVGTFSALLAARVAKVIAIEESAHAVEAARGVMGELPNVELICGRSELVLPELAAAGRRIDVVILDPPRAGCLPEARAAVTKIRPRRVIYVSCNPQSLGHDLAELCGANGAFDLASVQPVDMFPQTHHVECVATLTLRAASQ